MNAKKSIRKKDESRYDYLDKIQKTDYKKDYIYGFVLETDDGTFSSAENSHIEEDDEYIFILNILKTSACFFFFAPWAYFYFSVDLLLMNEA